MVKNDPTNGDLFNQSQAFRRDLVGIATSSVEINNIPLTPQPLKPHEMFNETLIDLGNHNLDMSAGVHEGCLSLSHSLNITGATSFRSRISRQMDFIKVGSTEKVAVFQLCGNLASILVLPMLLSPLYTQNAPVCWS